MIEITTSLFGLLGLMVNWTGFTILISIIIGSIIPLIYKDSKNIDSKISIGKFTLLHTTKENGNVRITVFHHH